MFVGSRAYFQSLIEVGKSFAVPFARQLVLRSFSGASVGSVKIQSVDGAITTLGVVSSSGSPTPCIMVHDDVFWLRVVVFGDIGFAESYMLHEISTTNLTAVFEFFIRNSKAVNQTATSGLLSSISGRITQAIPWKVMNDVSTAHLNATAHYSLSNDMFEAFLSPDMTYSAPLWLPSSDPRSATETLEEAQQRKLQYAISATKIRETDHVLEIGTGWGSFSILAARTTGCRVTTVTASGEQKKLAEQRIRAAGLEGRIVVLQADYRELEQLAPFDKIVSIEMIEHVGHDFLDTYFACVDRYLKADGGIGYFQCITIPETRYERYVKSEDFIKKYIFPGGHLPTVSGLVRSIDRGSKGNLIVEEIKSVGGHYSKALRCWKEKFEQNFEECIVHALHKSHPKMTRGDMEVFKRKWEVSRNSEQIPRYQRLTTCATQYYFCYCEAGFNTKALGDVGITVGRENCVALLEDI